jgi:hypothetical protein
MADVNKEIALKVTTDVGQTTTALKSAEERLGEAKKAMLDLALAGKQGSKEFRALAVEAGGLKGKIESVEKTVDGLGKSTSNIEVFSGAMQGVAAGFAIAQGTAALFAEGNEEVQEALLKVQSSLALLQGTEQALQLLRKESAAGQSILTARTKAYNLVVDASTGKLKLFRLALIATGIGAAVAAIGLLVANWDKLSKAVTDFISGSPTLTKVIGYISDGFTKLGKAIGVIPSESVAATKQMISDLEKQEKLLQASGADTTAIQKRLAQLRIELAKETGKGLAEAEEELTLLTAGEYAKRAEKDKEAATKRAELNKAAKEKAKEAAKAAAEIQVELNQTLEDLQAQNIANEEARALKQLEIERSRARKQLEDKKASDALLIEFDKQTESQRKAITDQAQADRDAKAKEDNDKILENAKVVSDALQQARIDSIENEFARAQAELEIQRQAKEAELILAGASREQILAVNKSFYEQSVKIAKEAEDKILADKIANLQKGLELAANGYQSLIDLQIAFGGESEKDQKRVFEINKKYNIAKAIIETIGAAQTAYASQLVVGDPTSVVRGAIAATLAIAQGLARVKMIKKTKFESPEDPANTGGGGSIPTGGGSGQQQPPAAFSPNVTPTNPTGQPNPMGQGQQPLRAYVLDRDIENSSSRRNMLRDFAGI